MKQCVILGLTLVLLAIFSFWQTSFLNKTHEQLKYTLYKIQESLQVDNYISANIIFKQLENEWENIHDRLDAFSDHTDVETFEKAMASLKVNIQEEERSVALEQCSVLVQVIKHIVESEKLSVATVF